ncbi:MAG: DNA repair protein RadC [Leptospiraceae bacterium]|nr:DNA repair protein RadC [Leptospiraceae bacterium]MDW7976355.1 DNA repair protein RadC [Leptospiraceae bacterium]
MNTKFPFQNLSIKELPIEERPREKLKQNGISSLTDLELMAIILGSGIKGLNVLQISEQVIDIIDKTKTIPEMDEFLKIPGIGEAKALLIIAAMEFFRRKWKPLPRKVRNAQDVFMAISHLANRKHECFVVVTLNGANEILNVHLVTKGLLNRTMIHPREVFALAIEDRANAIIIAHNHPSGNLLPGEEDIQTTQALLDASKILNIPILDHLIFSETNYYSFAENHLIQK